MLECIVKVLFELFYVIIEPVFLRIKTYRYGLGDPTYGRDRLPYSEHEKEAIYDNPEVRATRRKVFFTRTKPIMESGLEDKITVLPQEHGDELVIGWINYYVWEMPEVIERDNCKSLIAYLCALMCTSSMALTITRVASSLLLCP